MLEFIQKNYRVLEVIVIGESSLESIQYSSRDEINLAYCIRTLDTKITICELRIVDVRSDSFVELSSCHLWNEPHITDYCMVTVHCYELEVSDFVRNNIISGVGDYYLILIIYEDRTVRKEIWNLHRHIHIIYCCLFLDRSKEAEILFVIDVEIYARILYKTSVEEDWETCEHSYRLQIIERAIW